MLQELRLEFCSVSFYIGQWARRGQHTRMRKSSLQRRSLSSSSQSVRSFVQRLNCSYSLKNLEGSGFEIRELKQRRRRRQREPQKTIVLMSKTLALHGRDKLWYISLSSSANNDVK